MHAIPRNSAQFHEHLISSFFAITAQLRAMKRRKRKQPLRATEFRLETLFPQLNCNFVDFFRRCLDSSAIFFAT